MKTNYLLSYDLVNAKQEVYDNVDKALILAGWTRFLETTWVAASPMTLDSVTKWVADQLPKDAKFVLAGSFDYLRTS